MMMEVESTSESTINLAQSNDTEISEKLREEILDHIANSNVAYFKSQQVGEPDLNFQQKREIAKNLINQKPGQFLARFGQFLESSHLEYFTEIGEHDSYEIQFHIKQLKRRLCREKNQVDVRNRRFQALKKLVDEGTYFSETEMMCRNPLLYDQLIGQFLTKQEIKMRDQSDDNNKTFLGVLMDRMDREDVERLKQQQKDDEDGTIEEVDSSDEEEEVEEEEEEYNSEEQEQQSDGDMGDNLNKSSGKETEGLNVETHKPKRKKLSEKEKELLREEFISHMYESFIEGKDKDFDYSSKVDGNPEYECLTVRTQDEEERYFDSESPENASDDNCGQSNIEDGDGDDELDMFMKNLKPDPTPSDLAAEVANL